MNLCNPSTLRCARLWAIWCNNIHPKKYLITLTLSFNHSQPSKVSVTRFLRAEYKLTLVLDIRVKYCQVYTRLTRIEWNIVVLPNILWEIYIITYNSLHHYNYGRKTPSILPHRHAKNMAYGPPEQVSDLFYYMHKLNILYPL